MLEELLFPYEIEFSYISTYKGKDSIIYSYLEAKREVDPNSFLYEMPEHFGESTKSDNQVIVIYDRTSPFTIDYTYLEECIAYLYKNKFGKDVTRFRYFS